MTGLWVRGLGAASPRTRFSEKLGRVSAWLKPSPDTRQKANAGPSTPSASLRSLRMTWLWEGGFGRGFAAYLIFGKIGSGFVGLKPHAPSVRSHGWPCEFVAIHGQVRAWTPARQPVSHPSKLKASLPGTRVWRPTLQRTAGRSRSALWVRVWARLCRGFCFLKNGWAGFGLAKAKP